MANEKVKEFLESIGTDAKALLNDRELPQNGEEKLQAILRLAKEKGYELVPDDLERYLRETLAARKEKTDAQVEAVEKLADSDVEKAAGGAFWEGEDAPDGHEMGCVLTYHTYKWQKDNDIWCKQMYYCNGTYQHTFAECPHSGHD
ncbi:MAG: hypothetical protein IK099_10575 [Clostridia bacterium]|nr:hypothetical protein [Clostridia bacterium]